MCFIHMEDTYLVNKYEENERYVSKLTMRKYQVKIAKVPFPAFSWIFKYQYLENASTLMLKICIS